MNEILTIKSFSDGYYVTFNQGYSHKFQDKEKAYLKAVELMFGEKKQKQLKEKPHDRHPTTA